MRWIGAFDPHQRAQSLRVMIETAVPGAGIVERLLPRMAEWRMADIMRQAKCFGQILVQPQGAGKDAADLGNLETVGQAGPVMIAVRRDEDLRLGFQPAEGDRMDDPVAVTLEGAARPTSFAGAVCEFASAAEGWVGGKR